MTRAAPPPQRRTQTHTRKKEQRMDRSPNQDEDEEDEEDDDRPDEAAITSEDTMKVVSYFSHVRDRADFVASDANSQRIGKLSWMIDNLKLDVRNYNAMLHRTRQEQDDTIHKYKPCLAQNNWKMQSFLDTNSTVRRQNALVRHNKHFETKEDAAANELVFTPWWKDNTFRMHTWEEHRRQRR